MVKKKKSNFKGKVGADAKRQKTQGSSYGYLNLPKGVNVYTPVPGARELIDILPYEVTMKNHPDKNVELDVATEGTLWYKRPFKVHMNIGSDNDKVICRSSIGEKCPICEYRSKRQKAGAEKEELDELRPKNRNLYVVIPKQNKKLDEVPHVFDFSQYLFQNLLNDELEENEDYGVFPDLEDGLTLKIRWEEKTFAKNKYAEASRIDFKERDEAYDESILDDVPNLDEILNVLSYEELHAKFFEMEDEISDDLDDEIEEEDEDDEHPPIPSKKTSRRKSKPTTEEEDEDDDSPFKEDDESEEEDESENEYDEITWEELLGMDVTELCDVIEHYGLDESIDVDEFENVTDLAKAIAKELNIKVPRTTNKPKSEPKKQTRASRTKKTKKSEEAAEECPHGYAFGVDTDEYDECDDCPLWKHCDKKKEEEE